MKFHEGDSWRVDILTIYRRRCLLVVHEKTLYTFFLRSPEVKTIKDLIKQIREKCSWYDYDSENVFVGKGEDKKVTGSIIDMKKLIKYYQQDNRTKEIILDHINDTPFSMLGMDDPNRAVINDMKEKNRIYPATVSGLESWHSLNQTLKFKT